MDVAEHLRELEQKLHRSSVRKSAEAVDALLRDDFEEYGSSGRVYTKTDIIATLRDQAPRDIEMSHFQSSLLSETVALVRYRATIRDPGSPPVLSLRSSLWTLEEGAWRMLFHQGTTALTIDAPHESQPTAP